MCAEEFARFTFDGDATWCIRISCMRLGLSRQQTVWGKVHAVHAIAHHGRSETVVKKLKNQGRIWPSGMFGPSIAGMNKKTRREPDATSDTRAHTSLKTKGPNKEET